MSATPDHADGEAGNARPYSVSELAFALKRTLEDAYGFVRLRGELSKVTFHSNGHVYLTLKDERAAIDGVVWKGQASRLSMRPQQGMEVVVTGKITAYPAGSRYQIVIETVEPAGVGALLAQLERLKARLQAEGLFDSNRKRPLPGTPAVVGVVTSPTGAVIRDILHRIRDRWPCHVIVWPVVVQGDAAAAQVASAIAGFNTLAAGYRPDVLIVARGGGSVEDLWPFNDEGLVRAAAASTIPLISAIGHETDTTLIDFVSDRRAPTPTAAAEMATPVLTELRYGLEELGARMHRCGGRLVDDRRGHLTAAGRALTRINDLVELSTQRFNLVSGRLAAGLAANAAAHERGLVQAAARLSPSLLQRPHAEKAARLTSLSARLSTGLERNAAAHRRELDQLLARLDPALLQRPQALQARSLANIGARLAPAIRRTLAQAAERQSALAKLHASVDPERPLRLGFALVRRVDGAVVREGAGLRRGEAVAITFADKVTRNAAIDGAPAGPRTGKPSAPTQGDLF